MTVGIDREIVAKQRSREDKAGHDQPCQLPPSIVLLSHALLGCQWGKSRSPASFRIALTFEPHSELWKGYSTRDIRYSCRAIVAPHLHMAIVLPMMNPAGTREHSRPPVRMVGASPLARLLMIVALVYAFLAGLRTITDYDLGWQLATGRWVVQNHQVPSTDVLSYTATGAPWIYPVGSGLLFYGVFLLGGYAALSWLGALACVSTVGLLMRHGSIAAALLAILAIPRIAARTAPRAEMFTVVLFAVFLSLLWEHYTRGRPRLWLLPLLMVAWVNLHLGFVAGLALIAAYLGIEVLELPFPGERREQAWHRLKNSWRWLALTLAATLVNPWGWNIYAALARQNEAMAQHSQWINEWASVPLSWGLAVAQFGVRDTKGTFFLLLAASVVCIALAALCRQAGAAILLVAAAYLGAQHVRLQGLFAGVLVVVGGWCAVTAWSAYAPRYLALRIRRILTAGVAALLTMLALVRSVDLATNRHYLGGTDTATFGAGLSWWFPDRALSFIEQNASPKEIFNLYNVGGFLAWRLGPNYRDYADGRAIPFGPLIFEKQERLATIDPDSPEWLREADSFGIHTVVLPLGRYDGSPGALPRFCSSRTWAPVYLDEVSAVFVRRDSLASQLILRRSLDCATTSLEPPPSQDQALAFNHWANAALVFLVLGRLDQALSASDRAQSIFPESANLHFIRAKIFTARTETAAAEREYRAALALEPNDATWASLSDLYQSLGDFRNASIAMQRAADISARPHLMLANLAFVQLHAQQPELALKTLDEAARRAPAQAIANRPFQLDLARGRASAWSALGNGGQAIGYEEAATRIAPERVELWRELSVLYELNGRMDDANRARHRAEMLETNP